jgi:hypothetical protein
MSKFWSNAKGGNSRLTKVDKVFNELREANKTIPVLPKVQDVNLEHEILTVENVLGDGMKGVMFTPTRRFKSVEDFIAQFDKPELLTFERINPEGQAYVYRKDCIEKLERRKVLLAQIIKEMGLEGVDMPMEKLAEVKRRLTAME